MRNFHLVRLYDISGVSGPGVVAEGVEFADGRVCMCWLTRQARSLVIHANIADVEEIHGHNGATVIQWLDQKDG